MLSYHIHKTEHKMGSCILSFYDSCVLLTPALGRVKKEGWCGDDELVAGGQGQMYQDNRLAYLKIYILVSIHSMIV